jgi:multiple sugar transport system permease protein
MQSLINKYFIDRIDKHMWFYFLIPGILVLLLTSLFPLAYSLYISFSTWDVLEPGSKIIFGTLENYIFAFKNPEFWDKFLLTFKFASISLALELILGMVMALLITNPRVNKYFMNVYRGFLLLPIAMTPVVSGILWKNLFLVKYGPINHLLSLINIPAQTWISDQSTAIYSVIIVDIWMATTVVAFILAGGLLSLPKEMYEAANIDGASSIGSFFYITLPLLRPVFAVIILLRSMDLFRVFDFIYAMTFGGPGTSTEVLNLFIYKQGLKFLNITRAAAYSWIFLVVLLPLSFYLLIKVFVPSRE